MRRFSEFIINKRPIILTFFIGACLLCMVSMNWVKVNNSLTDYLSDSTETRQGLTLMEEEFTTYAYADVLVKHIAQERAEALCTELENLVGVKSVTFDDTEDHYKDANALYRVTFNGLNEDSSTITGLENVNELLADYEYYIQTEAGNPLATVISSEMLIVDAIALGIIILVLLLTSKTYGEIPVLLLTFGAAALLNIGTNFLMGEISFVTNSIAIVLQLALAIDYAIILCHRFTEEHKTKSARDAAIDALIRSIPEIVASSLTTVAGLLALTFMEYNLGFDIGVVMIKAILFSLISVFCLMPGLLVMFSGWIDKSHHRSFLPRVTFLGKFAYKTRLIIPWFFIIVIGFAFSYSRKADYVYYQNSADSIRENAEQRAKREIITAFNQKNQLVVIVPSGDYEKEDDLIADLSALSFVHTIKGMGNIEAVDGYTLTSKMTPREFSESIGIDYEAARLIYAGYAMNADEYSQFITAGETYAPNLVDLLNYITDKWDSMTADLSDETETDLQQVRDDLDEARKQLESDEWSRIIMNLDLPLEGEESFRALDIIRGVTAKYYEKMYLVGDTTSCYDLKKSFDHDNTMICLLSIIFVVAVLILTFKSIGLPILLIVIIQGSIWINFSQPYLFGNKIFFLTYLILSAIQMGSNIDYAIVISSHYLECKRTLPPKEAMSETLCQSFPTVITSGSILAGSGLVIGLITSNETISAIGVYLGTGTLISMFLVLFVLPQLLLFGDTLIRKTTFRMDATENTKKVGTVRLDGHVKGDLNGYFDGEIHGVFRGDLNAVISMGGIISEEEGDSHEA